MDILYENGVFVLDTKDKEIPEYVDEMDPFSNREVFDQTFRNTDTPLVTLVFIAYNNLEKYTKPAMQALLKYTSHIDMELILVDNGSNDGTLEYFRSVKFRRKRICRVTKNVGAVTAMIAVNQAIGRMEWGKYLCTVPNDIIVTKNWLDNQLRCIESDERIGAVVPVSNYVSNNQQVDLQYVDFEDMQKKAAVFNQSDPKKWEERVRVIPTTLLCRNSLYRLYQHDHALIYYFSDDDISFQYRRMGYKLMVCWDAFVYHGGSLLHKEPDKYRKTLEIGRELFRRKYFGIDAWNDTNDLNEKMVPLLLKPCLEDPAEKSHHILGVDVRCGQILLSTRNFLHRHGRGPAHLSACTREAKYWLDLKSICDGTVSCGNLSGEDSFDEIIIGECINYYSSMEESIGTWIPRLKPQGRMVFRYVNYPVSEGASIKFHHIENFLLKYSQCKVREISFDLLENEDIQHLWKTLKEGAENGIQDAVVSLKEVFADSCLFGRYSVGEVLVVVERVQ